MTQFFVDPAIVAEFLVKPYDLRAAWDKIKHPAGAPPAPGLRDYTPEERAHLVDEAQRLYAAQVATQLPPRPDAARQFKLSAGAPGSGKTTLLEQLLQKDQGLKNLLFSDPDERVLKLMPVYHRDIQAYGGGAAGLALAYTKWRWGSNWISNTMVNRACAEGRDILLGTTATSPFMHALYGNAHKAGYESETLIVCAPEDVRYESARRRFEDEGTRFTNDTKEKGAAFYDRLPSLLQHTDHFRLYWRDQPDAGAVLVAEGRDNKVKVYDRAGVNAIDRDVTLNKPDLSWKNLRQIYETKPPRPKI